MIRIGITGLLVSIIGFSFAVPAWAKLEKVGYIDAAKIFDGYQKTKDSEARLQAAGKKKEEERDAIVHEIRRLKDEQALLSEDAKEKKQEAIDVKIKELQEFDGGARKELGEQKNQTFKEIVKDIDSVVQRYGERKGFDMILNDQVLPYRNPRFDVTNDIVDELNRDYKAKKK
ncbi:MAG: OmpH family outer membrane protein [Candidatus Omnitrophica bacterium]|nr:OmpH family outer membrane protein [Candidatus Omnitrophota bacterium]